MPAKQAWSSGHAFTLFLNIKVAWENNHIDFETTGINATEESCLYMVQPAIIGLFVKLILSGSGEILFCLGNKFL